MTRVLIVDDQPGFRRQLRALLQIAGFEIVAEAGDIPEAEKIIRVIPADLAIVDVMLPGINGVEGTARLKSLAPNLRVILVSAYPDRVNVFRHAARDAGAETFIAKDDLDLAMARSWNQVR
ncbi:MAG: response regulator transcription factor [Chloroflexi bacterium]|nr:response regulator transcription factor [Chloroflexota bacterium]